MYLLLQPLIDPVIVYVLLAAACAVYLIHQELK